VITTKRSSRRTTLVAIRDHFRVHKLTEEPQRTTWDTNMSLTDSCEYLDRQIGGL